jgi:hypothetical protein
MTPPRPECTVEPCGCWHEKGCRHKAWAGQESCIFDDPERMEAWKVRMEKRKKEAKK